MYCDHLTSIVPFVPGFYDVYFALSWCMQRLARILSLPSWKIEQLILRYNNKNWLIISL